jgi:hypothetical protein
LFDVDKKMHPRRDVHGGINPAAEAMRIQQDYCQQLLLLHIEHFNPTHILFSTGWDGWFAKI